MTLRLSRSRLILIGLIACYVAWSGQTLAAGPVNALPVVKVMDQNVYLGADLDIILDEIKKDPTPEGLIRGVTVFLQAVQSTNFTERAEALAQEIQRQMPDVIGLQEVARFELQVAGVLWIEDYKQILLDALQARGLDYVAAVTSENTTATSLVDVDNNGVPDGVLRFTDRDAILVRNNVQISDVETAAFSTLRPLPPLPGFPGEVKRGYVALAATVRGKTYRFVDTHLENKGDDASVQNAQAAELIEVLDNESLPVILVGDFNSGPSDDDGSPYEQLFTAGFIDVWDERLGPRSASGDPGFTCCQDPGLLNAVSELDKRVDLIWVRPSTWEEPDNLSAHASIANTIVIGDDQRDRTPLGLWPSDHAGVASKLHVR